MLLLRLAAPVLRLAASSATFALLQTKRIVCDVPAAMTTCWDLFEASGGTAILANKYAMVRRATRRDVLPLSSHMMSIVRAGQLLLDQTAEI